MNRELQNNSIYTPGQIGLGTLIAGLPFGCWLISRNYQVLGIMSHARSFLWLSILSLLILPLSTFWISDEWQALSRFMIPMMSFLFTLGYAKHLQQEFLKDIEYRKRSYLKCIVYSIFGFFILFCYGAIISLSERLVIR